MYADVTTTSAPAPAPARKGSSAIIMLWIAGTVLTLVGLGIFSAEMRDALSTFGSPSTGAVNLSLLLSGAGLVMLQVAIIATGVRVGSRR